jgi:hypothetical protein
VPTGKGGVVDGLGGISTGIDANGGGRMIGGSGGSYIIVVAIHDTQFVMGNQASSQGIVRCP